MNRQPNSSGSHRYASIGGVPLVDPPIDDAEAKEVLSIAYQTVFNVQEEDVNLFALGIAQAIGLMEGGYGRGFHNNWGAITRTPNADGTCPADSFLHGDSSFDLGQYQTCFRAYETSLDGATDLLRKLYIDRPETFAYAQAGDIRGVAQDMYRTHYYLGTAPPDKRDSNGDFTNVNNYIDFIGRGVDQISFLYPSGDSPDVASGDSGIGFGPIIAIAALGGLVLALK